ncbi:hypothetical protein N8D56_02365 [Devosia sp. A8/3-2]|nr:hypothetical protein N8D56_02365 [Devosia sp. A8/3-2]
MLAGDRVIFTINKDNNLEWIADWARFYVKEHGATAVVVYDNGSTEYGLDDIRSTLAAVEGLKKFLVIPCPTDTAPWATSIPSTNSVGIGRNLRSRLCSSSSSANMPCGRAPSSMSMWTSW